MNSAKVQTILLLGIIITIVGGMLYLAEQEGMINVTEPAEILAAQIPYVKNYVAASDKMPAQELAELEKIQEEQAMIEKWEKLKGAEDELKKVEGDINQDRKKLSQWEGELERREKAIKEREDEFKDKDLRYKKAVKFYLTMRPQKAASILSKQDDILVIEIFNRMPERNVAAILSEMDATVAGTIMRKMAR
ncbi:MAG: hypothetical protein JKX97_07005 [Candidatus Lindowbacteria bacterium]|nr:hypothetical protein [Candidatus Lindowbacteria bacterium]